MLVVIPGSSLRQVHLFERKGEYQRFISRYGLYESEWEIIRVQEPLYERKLEAGQILWGEGELQDEEWNMSHLLYLEKDGKLGEDQGTWDFAKEDQSLQLTLNGEVVRNLIVFAGHDWENETETVLFTGLDSRGRSVWGKRTK